MEWILFVHSEFYKYSNSFIFYLATIPKEVQMNYISMLKNAIREMGGYEADEEID